MSIKNLVKVETESYAYIGYFKNDDEILYLDVNGEQTLNLHDVKGKVVITNISK